MNDPQLIQRVSTREVPVQAPSHLPKGKSIDSLFAFSYMGSAEFEWGALPKALATMRSHSVEMTVKRIRPLGGGTLWFVGREADLKDVALWVNKHLMGQTREKEPTFMAHALGLDMSRSGDWDCDGWWAIDQDVPWILFTSKKSATKWLKAL